LREPGVAGLSPLDRAKAALSLGESYAASREERAGKAHALLNSRTRVSDTVVS